MASFFAAELGALASLTGFVVVAISINLARILEFAWLPSRAAEALIAPGGAITATGLILVPEQSSVLLGAGAHGGLAWLAIGDIACIVAVVLNAWVLMIEILR